MIIKPSGLTTARSLDPLFSKYVHTDDSGAPIGATEVTQATQTARWGDVIAIAIRLNNVNLVTAHLENGLNGWDTAGTGSTIKTVRLKPNIALEDGQDTAVFFKPIFYGSLPLHGGVRGTRTLMVIGSRITPLLAYIVSKAADPVINILMMPLALRIGWTS